MRFVAFLFFFGRVSELFMCKACVCACVCATANVFLSVRVASLN